MLYQPVLVKSDLSEAEMRQMKTNGDDLEGGADGRGPSLAFESVNFNVKGKNILKV
jgi:hypothetical protein